MKSNTETFYVVCDDENAYVDDSLDLTTSLEYAFKIDTIKNAKKIMKQTYEAFDFYGPESCGVTGKLRIVKVTQVTTEEDV